MSNQDVPFCAERDVKELTSTCLQGFCSLSLIMSMIANIGTCVRGKSRHETGWCFSVFMPACLY